MADLEESIFQHNVPGRWSTFERCERSDVRREEVEEEVEMYNHLVSRWISVILCI